MFSISASNQPFKSEFPCIYVFPIITPTCSSTNYFLNENHHGPRWNKRRLVQFVEHRLTMFIHLGPFKFCTYAECWFSLDVAHLLTFL